MDDAKTIENPAVCAECGAKCCREWIFWADLNDEDRAAMREVGEEEYMAPQFWIDRWPRTFGDSRPDPPRVELLRVAGGTSPEGPRLYFWARCLDHDSETGLCRVYDERPRACREFPDEESVEVARLFRLRCPLIEEAA